MYLNWLSISIYIFKTLSFKSFFDFNNKHNYDLDDLQYFIKRSSSQFYWCKLSNQTDLSYYSWFHNIQYYCNQFVVMHTSIITWYWLEMRVMGPTFVWSIDLEQNMKYVNRWVFIVTGKNLSRDPHSAWIDRMEANIIVTANHQLLVRIVIKCLWTFKLRSPLNLFLYFGKFTRPVFTALLNDPIKQFWNLQ